MSALWGPILCCNAGWRFVVFAACCAAVALAWLVLLPFLFFADLPLVIVFFDDVVEDDNDDDGDDNDDVHDLLLLRCFCDLFLLLSYTRPLCIRLRARAYVHAFVPLCVCVCCVRVCAPCICVFLFLFVC